MGQTAKLPVGIQDFGKLREGGFLYVDKTAHVFKMAQAGAPCFLSRANRHLSAYR